VAQTSDPKKRLNSRTLARRFLAAAALLWVAASPVPAMAEDDVLQKAVNYVFTGTVDPTDPPEITNLKSCVVVVADPRSKRFIRYYLSRLGLDDPRIDSTYVGRQPRYQLDVESDKVVVEYLSVDKKTVTIGYKSAQIPLPGDLDRTRKALQFVAGRCQPEDAPKLPF
jgi:hypothetical protein